MPRLETASLFVLLALGTLTGCQTTEVSDEPPTPAELAMADEQTGGTAGAHGDHESLLFDCQAEPGAPHDTIRIVALMPEGGEDEAAGEVPAEFQLPGRDQGLKGHCLRESGRYSCASNDGEVHVTWAGEKPQASEKVRVQEKWLVGSKKYEATCQFKG